MILSRRSGLIGLGCLALRPTLPRKGAVAFHYEAVIGEPEAQWYRRFDVVVTGGVLDPAQTRKLRDGGCRLVAYEWMSAFYPQCGPSLACRWQTGLAATRSNLLLNSSPAGGGAAAPGKAAWWYDFGHPDLPAQRAEQLAQALARSGYDGIFFDTLGRQQLPPAIGKLFEQAHPGLDYERQQGEFLRRLRRQLPAGKLIFLNQGYRNSGVYLPHADFDLSESTFAYLRSDGAAGFRPWRNAAARWDTVEGIMSGIILPGARRYPSVSMVHLNYAAGPPATVQRALRYSYACAKLFNHESYLVYPGHYGLERDEIYFEDLGEPLSDKPCTDETGAVAWREYRRATVVINSGPRPARLPGSKTILEDPPRGYILR